MPNLVWRIEMKVKEITITEAEITIKPLHGAQQLAVDGKPVGQANDPALAQQIAQATKDGKLTINDPSKPAAGSQGAGIQEQPAYGEKIPTVNTSTNPPMVMDVNNTTGTKLLVTKTGEEITPDLISRSAPDWQPAYIKANGKTYQALKTGTTYKVGMGAYKEIMSGAKPSAPSDANKMTKPSPAPSTMTTSPAGNSPQSGNYPQSMSPGNPQQRESTDLADIKKLSGL